MLAVSAPERFGQREMFLDAAEQTEEWNRDQRAEYYDAADGYGDPPPDPSEYSDLAKLDATADRAEQAARAGW